ncbi:hypothetical protein, partial [Mycobacterium sp.]|uniref:hypothetical protein n=1 Tax=Mycobacterium sp. TaxID=1785 RepID=UPI003A88BC28
CLVLMLLFTYCGQQTTEDTADTLDVSPTPAIGSTCEAPCWFGIVPNVTTRQEVVEFLESGKITKPADLSFYENSEYNADIAYFYLDNSGETEYPPPNELGSTVNIWFDKGVVKIIDMGPRTIRPMSQIIDLYGEPDRIVVMDSTSEEVVYAARLLYYEGIDIRFSILEGSTGYSVQDDFAELSDNMRLTSITYVGPVTEETWGELFLVPQDSLSRMPFEQLVESSSPWNGMGMYPLLTLPDDIDQFQ